MRRALAAIALAIAAAAPAHAAAAPGEPSWAKRLEAAERYAADRAGNASIGIVAEDHRFHGYRANRQYASASIVKVMLMVAYLRHGDQGDEPLSTEDRALLGPMITRSNNEAATTVRDIVGNDALERLAEQAGMRRFEASVSWGSSQITARDQARWMFEIERHVPRRHREYAMNLLARIIPRQSWGIPPETPDGYEIRFKGGWGRVGAPTWTVGQVAQLEPDAGGRRFSLAILTRGSPTKEYGIATVRGVAERLLENR